MTLSDQSRDLPDAGDYGELVDSLDIANCLRLFDRKWNDLFKRKLSLDYRTWAKELMGVRNKVAHIGGQDFNDDDTWRALDTMARLCEAFDDEAAEEIRKLLREARYGSAEGFYHSNGRPHVSAERPKTSQAACLRRTLLRPSQLAGSDRAAPGCGAGAIQECRVCGRPGSGSPWRRCF